MDSWDTDRFETPVYISALNNRWDDEDADEDITESWDQEPEEEPVETPPPVVSPVKKAKKIGEKFEERERLKKEKLKNLGLIEETEPETLTPEELLAEKLRRQKLQEEADLDLAIEVFGVDKSSSSLEKKEDFEEIKNNFQKLIAASSKNANFINFTEEIVHALCMHLCSQDLKKLHVWIGNQYIEKTKLEKGDKPKKNKNKGGKVKLKVEADSNIASSNYYIDDDFDEFI